MVDAWKSAEELGLKANILFLRHLPEHTYVLVLPENMPNEATSQGLAKSRLSENKLSSLCGKS